MSKKDNQCYKCGGALKWDVFRCAILGAETKWLYQCIGCGHKAFVHQCKRARQRHIQMEKHLDGWHLRQGYTTFDNWIGPIEFCPLCQKELA